MSASRLSRNGPSDEPERNTGHRGSIAWDNSRANGATQREFEEWVALEGDVEKVDYYAILNVSKDATPNEIVAAYRRLSIQYHPDKHRPEQKEKAEELFRVIQEAYNILNNPQKRKIYDAFGSTPIKQNISISREVGNPNLTSEELQERVERFMERHRRHELSELVQISGSITASVNASSMFYDLRDENRFIGFLGAWERRKYWRNMVSLTNLHLSQQFSLPLLFLARLFNKPMGSRRSTDTKDETSADLDEPLSIPMLHFEVGCGGLPLERFLLKKLNDIPQESKQKTFWLQTPVGAAEEVTLMADNPFNLLSNVSISSVLSHRFVPTFRPFMEKERTAKSISDYLAGTSMNLTCSANPRVSGVLELSRTINRFNVVSLTHLPLKLNRLPRGQLDVSTQVGSRHFLRVQWRTGTWSLNNLLYRVAGGGFNLSFIRVPPREIVPQPRGRGPSIIRTGSSGTWTITAIANATDLPLLNIQYTRRLWEDNSEWILQSQKLKRTTNLRSVFDNYNAQMEEDKLAFKSTLVTCTAVLGFGNILRGFVVGIQRAVSVNNKIGIHFGCGLGPGHGDVFGVAISWSRLGQDIAIPICIAPLQDYNFALSVIVLTATAYTALEHFVIRPRIRRKRRRLIESRTQNILSVIRRRREKAQDAVSLAARSVSSMQLKMRQKNGLVILDATWGADNNNNNNDNDSQGKSKIDLHLSSEKRIVDVTIALSALIHGNQLIIPRGIDKSLIMGFYDPSPFEHKTLRVRYQFNTLEHFVEVKDVMALTLPMKEHAVDQIEE